MKKGLNRIELVLGLQRLCRGKRVSIYIGESFNMHRVEFEFSKFLNTDKVTLETKNGTLFDLYNHYTYAISDMTSYSDSDFFDIIKEDKYGDQIIFKLQLTTKR